MPVSAHGTNPASAQVAGLKVVYVPTSSDGSVHFEDFKRKVLCACRTGRKYIGVLLVCNSEECKA